MTPRFLADADFNHKIVLALRRKEPAIDMRSAYEGGIAGKADEDVLRIAADLGCILVSHDRKTMPVHLARFLATRSSPGVIMVAQDLDIGAAVEEILLIWAASDAEEWRDQLAFIPI